MPYVLYRFSCARKASCPYFTLSGKSCGYSFNNTWLTARQSELLSVVTRLHEKESIVQPVRAFRTLKYLCLCRPLVESSERSRCNFSHFFSGVGEVFNDLTAVEKPTCCPQRSRRWVPSDTSA